jgi:hypothetical protein
MDSPYRAPGRVVLPPARRKRRKLTPTRLLLAVAVALAGFALIGFSFVSCALLVH